jgi:hypothetical protein
MTASAKGFIAVAVLCVLAVGGVVAFAATKGKDNAGGAQLASTTAASAAPVAALDPKTESVLRAVDKKSPRLNGKLYRVDATGKSTPIPGAPACERVAVAGGRGICLYLAKTGVDYRAAILDKQLHVRKVLGLTGLPSRARVSPDGAYAGITTFAYGDSYAAPGTFSTRTQIVDLRKGAMVADLEQWRFTLDGKPVTAVDRNFWGLSFKADDDGFYATMATGDHHYLVEGSVAAKGGAVLRDDVECPSLSPDQTRVAYKKTLGGGKWRLHVYDLKTKQDLALAETRSIDDQPSWLDDGHVAYFDGKATYVAAADGTGTPQLLVAGADSPTVLRWNALGASS